MTKLNEWIEKWDGVSAKPQDVIDSVGELAQAIKADMEELEERIEPPRTEVNPKSHYYTQTATQAHNVETKPIGPGG